MRFSYDIRSSSTNTFLNATEKLFGGMSRNFVYPSEEEIPETHFYYITFIF